MSTPSWLLGMNSPTIPVLGLMNECPRKDWLSKKSQLIFPQFFSWLNFISNKFHKQFKKNDSGRQQALAVSMFAGLLEYDVNSFQINPFKLYCRQQKPLCVAHRVSSYSEAWEKVIPVKVGDKVSVYISQPVPWR